MARAAQRTFKKRSASWQDRLNNSEVEAFDGAGHLGPLTHASEVADALVQFAETNA